MSRRKGRAHKRTQSHKPGQPSIPSRPHTLPGTLLDNEFEQGAGDDVVAIGFEQVSGSVAYDINSPAFIRHCHLLLCSVIRSLRHGVMG
jgi:hypothetical protein